jgi:hypothetical protein
MFFAESSNGGTMGFEISNISDNQTSFQLPAFSLGQEAESAENSGSFSQDLLDGQ